MAGTPADRRHVLRQPVFSRLWAASVASSIGSAAGTVALTLLVFSATGSAFDLALLGIATLVPRAGFGIVAGALADRHDRVRLMILADLTRAVSVGVLALLLIVQGFQLSVTLVVVVVLAVGQTTFFPAVNAFLPTAMPEDDLGTANGLMASAQQVTSIVGTPLGGLIVVSLGFTLAFVFNAATYAVSALFIVAVSTLISLRAPAHLTTPRKPSRFFGQVREGFRYLRGQPGLLKLTVGPMIANFCIYMLISFLVIYVYEVLHQGALVYGFLSATLGIGFAVGALLVGRLRTERNFGRWFCCGWGAGALCLTGVVFTTNSFVAGLCLFGFGIGGGLGNTTFFTAVQRLVPNHLLGRYLSLDQAGSLAASPAGQIVGAVFISTVGLLADFATAALGVAAVSFGLLLFSDVRLLGVPEASMPGAGT